MEFGLIYHAQHAGFCSELIPLLSYICNHPFCSRTLYEKLCFPPFLLVQSNKTLLYSAQAWLWSNLLFYCWIYFWYLKFVKDYCFDVVSLYSGKKLESNSHDLKLFCKVFHLLLMPMQAVYQRLLQFNFSIFFLPMFYPALVWLQSQGRSVIKRPQLYIQRENLFCMELHIAKKIWNHLKNYAHFKLQKNYDATFVQCTIVY